MPKFYSELQEASFENLSSDPSSSVGGKVWRNTTENRIKTDDGTDKRALIRNDNKAVIGNSGTAAENTRLHRGGAGIFQHVPGDDATAEGSLATSLNQVSTRVENFTDAGKPSAGNAGRVLYITDLQSFLGDNGSSYAPLGGGGGGGALQWIEAALAPIASVENEAQVYNFEAAGTQYLYADIRVPTTYLAGRQIKMKMTYYTPDTSGTALLTALATLIITGTDAIDSVTNQRTSSNSAATVSGAANLLRSAEFDLTDASGAVNSVAVTGGDLIRIRLTRGTDTATSELRALVFGAEVIFS